MLIKLKPKSDFTKNVLTLMTGTTIAQAIPIAISPILTRIYSPNDFGVFALFIAIASIFGSIATGRYELAIMLPKKDEDAINILALGFIINILLSLFLLFIVVVFHDKILNLLNNKEISIWLYLIPISVFLVGCFNLLNYFNNRKKQYKDLAKANVYKSIGMAIVQLSLGFLKAGVVGLISGQIFSQIISNTKLFLNIQRLNLFEKTTKVKIIAVGKRYQNFPKYSMLAVFANSLSQHFTNILISSFFNLSTLGFYSLVQRLLVTPSALIGGAITQVFFQTAIQEKQDSGVAIRTFQSTINKLVIVGIIIYLPLFFIVEDLFTFIFGQTWTIAGIYAKIMIPLFFIRFISSHVAVITTVFEKLKINLFINLILVFSSLFIIYFCKNMHFIEFIKYFTFFMSIWYFVFIVYYYNLAKGNI